MKTIDGKKEIKSKQKLALGTVQFGMAYGIAGSEGQVQKGEVEKILKFAREADIDTLDTAIAYGESEKVLGSIGVSEFQIITKLPGLKPGCDDVGLWVDQELKNSLKRLNVTHVHAILLHKPSDLLSPKGDELYKSLQCVKQRGLANKIGISIYEPKELDALCPHFDFDIIQSPLNIIDRRIIDTGWADTLCKKGIELHTRSAFLQGLLLMNGRDRPQKFNHWQSLWDEWEDTLEEKELSPLQACLHYALSISQVDRVVVGVNNLEQFQEIASVRQDKASRFPKWSSEYDHRLLNPARWNEL